MNTQTLIGVIVAIAVIGGGAWYLSTRDAGPTEEGQQTSENRGSSSFAEFVAQGGSRTCSVTVNNETSPAEGTVYVSGGNVRADFVAKPVTMNGQEVSAHMIQTGGFVYSWTDTVPQGVKIALTAGASSQGQGFDMNASVDYDCSPWVPDTSKFTVPSTVTFMEIGAGGVPTPQ